MTDGNKSNRDGGAPIELRIGHREIVVRRRYEVAGIINDLMIGVWFAIGSILFLSPGTTRPGTVLFLLGSVELLIRPIIRLTRDVHVQRISPAGHGFLAGSSHDF